MALVTVDGVSKLYTSGAHVLKALDEASFSRRRGGSW